MNRKSCHLRHHDRAPIRIRLGIEVRHWSDWGLALIGMGAISTCVILALSKDSEQHSSILAKTLRAHDARRKLGTTVCCSWPRRRLSDQMIRFHRAGLLTPFLNPRTSSFYCCYCCSIRNLRMMNYFSQPESPSYGQGNPNPVISFGERESAVYYDCHPAAHPTASARFLNIPKKIPQPPSK